MQTATRTPSRNGHAEAALRATATITRLQILAAQREAIEVGYQSGLYTAGEYGDRLKSWRSAMQLHAEAQAVASTVG